MIDDVASTMHDDSTCRCDFPEKAPNHIQPGMWTCINCGRIIPDEDSRSYPTFHTPKQESANQQNYDSHFSSNSNHQPPPGAGQAALVDEAENVLNDAQGREEEGDGSNNPRMTNTGKRNRAAEMAKGSSSKRMVSTALIILMLTMAMSVASLYLQWGNIKALSENNAEDGDNGSNGSNGLNGQTSLIIVLDEPAGLNCTEGGLAIHNGIDLNSDGILQTTEYIDTHFMCNAENGQQGDNGSTGSNGSSGPSGPQGDSGYDALSEIIPLPIGNSTCPTGGIEIRMGIDLNEDGILQANEVQTTEYVCNGNDGGDGGSHESLMRTITAPPTYCPDGIMLRFGEDDGDGGGKADDGILHWDEAGEAFTICTGVSAWNETHPEHLVGPTDSFASQCSQRVAFQAKLIFTSLGSDGCELWLSDGTLAGTQIILDINPSGDSTPGLYLDLSVHDGKIWFDADDGANGRELWTSDGTAIGTHMVIDIASGAADSNPGSAGGGIVWHNGAAWFNADNGISGNELWRSDGTESGTNQVADICIGACSSSPGNSGLISFAGKVWFSADDGINGFELWASTPSDQGTQLFFDIDSANTSSNPGLFAGWALFDERIWFDADDGQNGRELWYTNGSIEGTQMHLDIAAGNSSSLPGKGTGLVAVNGALLFRVENSSNASQPNQLWSTDGTINGTALLSPDIWDIAGQGTEVIVSGDEQDSGGQRMWFSCRGMIPTGVELCSSDGTTLGTQVHDLRVGLSGMDPTNMVTSHGYIYFNGEGVDGINDTGVELWRMSLEGGGAELVMDIWTGSGNSAFVGFYGGLTNVENTIFFSADDGTRGHEMYHWGQLEIGASDLLYLP
jgi:ELWxxDGT repeat protein